MGVNRSFLAAQIVSVCAIASLAQRP